MVDGEGELPGRSSPRAAVTNEEQRSSARGHERRPNPVATLTTLAQINAARAALAEAKTLDDIVRIRDVARAAELLLRTVRESGSAALDASEVRILAERQAGELLKATPKRSGGAVEREQLSQGAIVAPASLDELGVTKDESSRWQKLAAVPAGVVSEYVAREKAASGEITTVGLLRAAAHAELASTAGITSSDVATFIEVCGCLLEIREKALWRGLHATFDDYVRERWGFDSRAVHQYVEIAETLGAAVAA